VFADKYDGNFRALNLTEHALASVMDDLQNATATWQDLERISADSALPVVVKGVLRADDAVRAIDHGAKALVVSNHGGRQLDRAVATLDAVADVVAAVRGRAEVYMDGGVRRGLDVVIALALGARGVFIGRPFLAALAVAGEAGVRRLFELLRAELVDAMLQLGQQSATQVERDILARPT
jgi:4-hydroxymandelate oxidase